MWRMHEYEEKGKKHGKKGKRNPRDTVNYTLYGLFGEPVYYGITNNLDRRLREHERDGKAFYDYSSSSKRTRTRADREETRSIHQHQDENFFGVAPVTIFRKQGESHRITISSIWTLVGGSSDGYKENSQY